MSFSKILVICLYTETVELDQFSQLATLVLDPCTRRITIWESYYLYFRIMNMVSGGVKLKMG